MACTIAVPLVLQDEIGQREGVSVAIVVWAKEVGLPGAAGEETSSNRLMGHGSY